MEHAKVMTEKVENKWNQCNSLTLLAKDHYRRLEYNSSDGSDLSDYSIDCDNAALSSVPGEGDVVPHHQLSQYIKEIENLIIHSDSENEWQCGILEEMKDLLNWLKHFQERQATQKNSNVQKYFPSAAFVELQHYEKKKNAILATLLNHLSRALQLTDHVGFKSLVTLSGGDSPADGPKAMAVETGAARDQPSKLSRLLVAFRIEWQTSLSRLHPIDPKVNVKQTLADVATDLEEIRTWLSLLRPSLPGLRSWMATLATLSEMQRLTAARFYQTSLREIREHTHTLSSVKHVLDDLKDAWSARAPDKGIDVVSRHLQLTELLQADCHLIWLQLLELTLCAEETGLHSAGLNRTHGKVNLDITSLRIPEVTFSSVSKDSRSLSRETRASCSTEDLDRLPVLLDDSGAYSDSNEQHSFISFNRTEVSADMVSPDSDCGNLECGFESALNTTGESCLEIELNVTQENVVRELNCMILSRPQVPVDCDHKSSQVMALEAADDELQWMVPQAEQQQIRSESLIASGSEQGVITEPQDSLSSRMDGGRNRAIRGCNLSATVKNDAKRGEHSSATSGREEQSENAGFKQGESIAVCEASTRPDSCEFSSTPPPPTTTRTTHHGQAAFDGSPECCAAGDAASTGEPPYCEYCGMASEKAAKKVTEPKEACNDFQTPQPANSDPSSFALEQYMTTDRSTEHEAAMFMNHSQDNKRDIHGESACRTNLMEPTGLESSGSDDTEGEVLRNSTHRPHSYLDAATKAEAIVRQRYQPDSLKSWLCHLASSSSGTENSSLVVVTSVPSDCPAPAGERAMSETSLSEVLADKAVDNEDEITEPPFNWDDYQASLYSSSCDTDGVLEPVKQYVEEFAWDEDDLHAVSCLEERPPELFGKDDPGSDVREESNRLGMAQSSPSPYKPFASTQTAVPDKAAGTGDSLGRQDTMELLSASTSVIFSQPAGNSATSEDYLSEEAPRSGAQPTTLLRAREWSPRHAEREVGTMRTHPDGGSQNQLAVSDGECDEVTTQSGLQADPIYESFWKKVEHLAKEVRRFQTLPFSSRRRRALLRFSKSDACASVDAPAQHTPLGANRIHRPHRRFGSQSLIHHYSEKEFTAISSEFSQLVTSPALLDKEGHCSGNSEQNVNSKYLSLGEWQKSLSDIIWRAEGNVALLEGVFTDSLSHSMESLNSSEDERCGAGTCSWTNSNNHTLYHQRRPPLGSSKQDLLSKWINLVDEARNRLLMSCSEDAVRSRLSPLRVRLKELNESVRCVLQDMEYLGQLESKMGKRNRMQKEKGDKGSADAHRLRSSLNVQLKQCLAELESICGSVEQLRCLVNCKRRAVVSTVSRRFRSKTAPALLIPEVELSETIQELAAQLEANRIILSQVATIGLDPPNATASAGSASFSKASPVIEVLPSKESSNNPILQLPANQNSPPAERSTNPRNWLRRLTFALFGGLLAVAYLVACRLLGSTRPVRQTIGHGEGPATPFDWTQMVVEQFVFSWRQPATGHAPCRAWRDRLPSVVEFTQSQRPY